MIDATAMDALVDRAAADPELSPARVARFLEGQPRFQNIDYPLALPPLLVDGARLEAVRGAVERYVAVLEKVVALYREDPEVRRFFGLEPEAVRLIEAEGTPARSIWICRLDGYVDADTSALRVLENNADAPAGTLFTPRLNRLVRGLLGERLSGAPPRLPMDSEDPFLEELLAAYRQRGGSADPEIAVLQPRGKSNVESQELSAAFQARGLRAAVVDPRDLRLEASGLTHQGRRIDLVWNKINMLAWQALVGEAPEVVDLFAEAWARGVAPVHLNSFGARHVAEAKTSLALLHDPRFSDRFSPAELDAARALVPWTAKLERGAQVALEGRRWALPDLMHERRPDLVLKQRYDIRGDGVTVGRAVDAGAWRQAVDGAWDTGAVVQRYVPPTRCRVLLCRDGAAPAPLNVSLDSFLFSGRLVGLGAKASAHAKVNLFQGGSKLAVCVTGGPRG